MPVAKSILVIEDDPGVQSYLKELFLDNGYNVQITGDGAAGLAAASKLLPDLVVLDLGLPNMSGETVCQELKNDYPTLPIIILTAKEGPNNIVAGFNLGADDYITKPFDGSELLARVKARLRPLGDDEKILKVGDLTLDPKTLEVARGKRQIPLTRHEFELLKYLMTNPGQVLSREMILNRVWSYAPDVESRVVDIYIGYLRKKIDQGSKKPLIHSNRGFGYSLKQ